MQNIKELFPIFKNNPKLKYLDSAAITQKPKCVIDAVSDFYSNEYSNIGRGVYDLAYNATNKFQDVKENIKKQFNASNYEVIFTLNTTYGINLIANIINKHLNSKNERMNVIISSNEHHSNILPWNQLGNVQIYDHQEISNKFNCKKNQIKVNVISITHCCNITGQIFDIENIISNTNGAFHIIDGAQAAPHMQLNIDKINPDFYVFSSAKMYGPSGVGIILMKKELMDILSPIFLGGGTVEYVLYNEMNNNFDIHLAEGDAKFNPGTPSIENVIGFNAAMNFINKIKYDTIISHDKTLRDYIIDNLNILDHVNILYSKPDISTISFNIKNIHSHDVVSFLNDKGISIRAGHMCAMPTLQKYNVTSACRISCGVYNTIDDINAFLDVIKFIKKYT